MPIDFVLGNEVNSTLVFNGDGSSVQRLARADGTASADVVGIRPDGSYQRFSIPPATAAALGLQLDASGRVKEVA